MNDNGLYQNAVRRDLVIGGARALSERAILLAIDAALSREPNLSIDYRWEALNEAFETLRSDFVAWLETRSEVEVHANEPTNPPF